MDPAEIETLQANEERTDIERADAQRDVDGAVKQRDMAQQRATEVADLAHRAIPLLGARCPVCRQEIDPADVEAHLRELIEFGGADLPALSAALEGAAARLATVDARSTQLRAQRDELEARVKDADALREARERWRADCEDLASTAELLHSSVRADIKAGSTAALSSARASADQLTAVTEELAALLGTSGLSEEVERQRELVRTSRETVAELGEQAARGSRQAAELNTLSGAATQAITGVTRGRFASLQPLIDDIFARLAPHPAFTTLGFDMGVSYRSGVADPFVKDPESGATGDPLLVFSSSQANVAALTYFLALSWAADTKALPFLLLDDPLQSMDDVNALGFADLCRHVRRRRQLVVSTHEQRLASLLERKLTPRSAELSTRTVHFTGWDREGPTIEQTGIEPESAMYLLEAG